jgi:N4-gp56 family major capsid protein
MATTDTVSLAPEIKAAFDADFYMAVQSRLYHDQFSYLKEMNNGVRGSTWEWPIVESLQPQTSTLDELVDVVPQRMVANAISIPLREYGGVIEITKFAVATSYSDVLEQAALANGYNMAESIDLVARAALGQGSRQFFAGGVTSRAALDGKGNAAHRITPAFLERLVALARSLRMPLTEDGSVVTILHPFVFYDLLQNQGIRDMAIRLTPEVLFNGELAYWGGCRIVVAANAKAFWGEGAAPSSGAVATTLAAPANPGDTNIKVADVTNITVGKWLAIRDAAEPGNTWTDTNELFFVTNVGTAGASGSGVDGFAFDPGPGDGGGLRYAHATGTAVNNNSSVYPFPILGPESLIKVASSLTGPFGETVITPSIDHLGRFLALGWYLIAGWGRPRAGWLHRGECGASEA